MLHWHSNDPSLLMHNWSHPPLAVAHSSTSVRIWWRHLIKFAFLCDHKLTGMIKLCMLRLHETKLPKYHLVAINSVFIGMYCPYLLNLVCSGYLCADFYTGRLNQFLKLVDRRTMLLTIFPPIFSFFNSTSSIFSNFSLNWFQDFSILIAT